MLRSAGHSVTKEDVDQAWGEPVQRDRALASLITDGLVIVVADDTFALPD